MYGMKGWLGGLFWHSLDKCLSITAIPKLQRLSHSSDLLSLLQFPLDQKEIPYFLLGKVKGPFLQ